MSWENPQTFLVKDEGPSHGDPEIQALVLHWLPKVKLQNIIRTCRREKGGHAHHYLLQLSNMVPHF